MRHFDVQLIGGMVLHDGKIAEMRTGEGKTLTATLRGLSERARRQGRPRGHGQRLPGRARRRVDGQGLQVPRHDGRRRSCRSRAPRTSGSPTRPTSPTAPTTSSASTTCATTWNTRRPIGASAARLCDRRRGRLDPDRRGAHAADHLRPGRGSQRAVRAHERGAAAADAPARRRRRPATSGSTRRRTRCTSPRPATTRSRASSPHGPAGGEREPVRAAEHHPDAPPERGVAGASPVPPRPAVRGAERRDHHRRRVHRPSDAGPALVRGPAPGGRGQGEGVRSSPRTRPTPRSPSRTTSACTASSPA